MDVSGTLRDATAVNETLGSQRERERSWAVGLEWQAGRLGGRVNVPVRFSAMPTQ
jgi:hypothetical protein